VWPLSRELFKLEKPKEVEMSRNYELLTQLAEKEIAIQPPVPIPAPAVAAAQSRVLEETAAGEGEAKLVQRLFLLAQEGGPRTVVFTGTDESDGSSSVCARASEILAARATGSVCLIDAHLSSPSLHARYGLENRSGLTDAIFKSGSAREFARQVPGRSLWLMTTGSSRQGREAILPADLVRSRVAELREHFGYVLISAPPVNLYPDAILFGQFADGVVLVLKANSTHRAAAMKVKESFEASNVKLLGAVLNDRTFPIPEALYRRL
jgi:Mrp family chromosome partitioning ATPase